MGRERTENIPGSAWRRPLRRTLQKPRAQLQIKRQRHPTGTDGGGREAPAETEPAKLRIIGVNLDPLRTMETRLRPKAQAHGTQTDGLHRPAPLRVALFNMRLDPPGQKRRIRLDVRRQIK